MVQKCPHCGGRIKTVLYKAETNKRSSTFQSVQPMVNDRGFFGMLKFLGGRFEGSRLRKPDKTIRVISDIRKSPTQMLLCELDMPGVEGDYCKLARVYVDLGLSWSRANSVEVGGISQPLHRQIQGALLRLRFLEQRSKTQYALTDAGLRFFRHYANNQ